MIYGFTINEEDDELRFRQLYEKYGDDIYRRIKRMIHNPQDAEDILQNTWLCVASNMPFYRGKDDLSSKAYILRIAKYKTIDFYHKQSKEKERIDDFCHGEDMSDADEENILFHLCNQTDAETIRVCIDCLDEIYSDILNGYYLHERTIKELSRMYGLKENTVRVRLKRGRVKLLKLLEGRCLNETTK